MDFPVFSPGGSSSSSSTPSSFFFSSLFLSEYANPESVAKGGQGTVFSATSKRTQQRVAVKILEGLSEAEVKQVEHEVFLVEKVIEQAFKQQITRKTYPFTKHFVNYTRSFCEATTTTTSSQGSNNNAKLFNFYIEMPFYELGNFSMFLERRRKTGVYFEIGDVLDFFLQLARAIQFLQGMLIMHRDLKLQNVLIEGDIESNKLTLKITDYGLAKFYSMSVKHSTVVGSFQTMSPEVRQETKNYDLSADIFSLGCMFLEIVELKLNTAFSLQLEKDEKAILKAIAARLDERYQCKALTQLIVNMLSLQPHKRPTIDEVVYKLLRLKGCTKKEAQDGSLNPFTKQKPDFSAVLHKYNPIKQAFSKRTVKLKNNLLFYTKERTHLLQKLNKPAGIIIMDHATKIVRLKDGFKIEFRDRTHTFRASASSQIDSFFSALENCKKIQFAERTRMKPLSATCCLTSLTPMSPVKLPRQSSLTYLSQATSTSSFLKDIDIIKQLGKGGFGTVALVKNTRNNKFYALKIVRKQENLSSLPVAHIKREIDIHTTLDHPYIVRCHASYIDEEVVHLLLEYGYGNLEEFLKYVRFCLPMNVVRHIAAQIALALDYIHSKGIVYRDLKPSNVLFAKDGAIKLTDFGLSKCLGEQKITYTACGTADYVSPEIIENKGHSTSSDWWTFGILLYEIVTNSSPFVEPGSPSETVHNIVQKDPNFSHYLNGPKEFLHLVAGCLNKDPEKRFHFQHIQTHPFFSCINWKQMEEGTAQLPEEVQLIFNAFASKFAPDKNLG